MLQAIRDRLVGWVAWGIVILISVPFIVLGVTDFGSPPRENIVAEVNEETITQRDYRRRYDARRQALQRQLGASYRADVMDQLVQQQVINSLVEEKLLQMFVEQHNIQVGDEELAAAIQSDSSFQKNGKFDFPSYRSILGQSGFTPESYEQYLRDDRKISILPRIIESSSFITESRASQYTKLLNQKRDVDYVIVGRDHFPNDLVVSEDEAKAYYDSNPTEFTRPEQVRLEYIRSSASLLAESLESSEDNIRQYYEDHIDRYAVEEQRTASHILLALEEGKTLEDSPKVKQTLQEIQDRLEAGESFEKLAEEFSEDPGSAQQGGSLGQVARGVMVAPFEEALYALTETGQISEPVRTSFGIHLIRLDDLKPRQVKSFEEVKGQLQSEYAMNKAVELFYDQSERMAELSYERPDSLTSVAEVLDIPIHNTGWISRDNDQPGVEGNRDVLRAAFSERLKSEMINSDPIEIGENDAVIIRVLESRPASLLPYEEVAEQARIAAITGAMYNRLKQYAEQLASRLKQGERLSDIAASESLTLKSQEGLQRTNKDISADLSKGIFSMPAPQTETPEVDTISLEDGTMALVVLRGVSVEAKADSKDIKQRLTTIDATREAKMMLADFREQAKVVIHKDKL